MGRSCADCTRAELLRAAAGRGLPSIEPGMPAPAGIGMTRRSMLLRSAGVALAVYGASKLDLLAAEEAVAAGGPSNAVVVQVFLPGGIDALSVLAPAEDSAYRRLRPRLALAPGAGAAFGEDPRLRWHPSAAALARLHGEGKVAVMPAVGYTHPDQSHFVSRRFYEVGALAPQLRTGWMGRYLDRVGTADNPLQGLALDSSLAPALATARVPVAALQSSGDYSFWARNVWGEPNDLMLDAFVRIGQAHGSGDAGHALTVPWSPVSTAMCWSCWPASLDPSPVARSPAALGRWNPPAVHASVFGSAARGDGTTDSGIDLFVVRPAEVTEDDDRWREQVEALGERVRTWTGNHLSVIEQAEAELPAPLARGPIGAGGRAPGWQ